MADIKKISELSQIQSLSNDDEFVVVDKSTTSGTNASSSGKTSRVTLSQLKQAVGASGPKGDKGDRGDQGLKGDQGIQGDRGLKGDKGDQGDVGPRGPEGSAGLNGQQGPSGSDGSKGAPGSTGAKGSLGAKGNKGDKGSVGAKGSLGLRGVPGQTGPEGPVGAKGALGPLGKTGPVGLKGKQGSQGVQGNSNAHFAWTGVNVASDATGQRMMKRSGGDNWTTGYAYTNLSYANGCSLSCKPYAGIPFFVGLTHKPGMGSRTYSNINYGVYLSSNRRIYIYIDGNNVGTDFGGYDGTSIVTITHDNNTIRWYHNGKLLKSLTVGQKTLHAQVAIHSQGTPATRSISFSAMGSVGPKGNKGDKGSVGAKGSLGAKGNKGDKGSVGAKGSLGAKGNKGDKGAKGDSGVFNGGTITSPTTIDSTSDQKLILRGSSSPYIRFREGGTDKAYIRWHANGNLYFTNQETNDQLRIGKSKLTFHVGGDKDYNVLTDAGGIIKGALNITNTASCWNLFRIHKANSDKEGGQLELESSDGKTLLAMDMFDDSVSNYMNNLKSKYNFRFFNATTGQLFAAIGDKGAQLRRGWLKIFHDDPISKSTHIILYRKYTGASKKLYSHDMVKNAQYESFRIQTIGDLNDANPASIIDSTSLYFRNNDLYSKWNKSTDVKRGVKAGIDPAGNILCVGKFSSNYNFSDLRLKKDINKIDSNDALSKVKQLQGVTFKWKEENASSETNVGLIAQEVQKIVPEIVSIRPRLENSNESAETPELTDRLYVEYSRVVPLLIESVKKLSSTIDSLNLKVNELESKLK